MNLPKLSFDPKEDCVFMELGGVRLTTREEITDFFVHLRKASLELTGGKSAYVVVSYDGFFLDFKQNAFYAEQMKKAAEGGAKAMIRYTSDPLQRAAAKVRGITVHLPSNVYASREEALEVLRGIRAGTISTSA